MNAGSVITSTRVALAKAGQFKATFQTKTWKELVALNVVVDGNSFRRNHSSRSGGSGGRKSRKSKNGKMKYIFVGDEGNHDQFTISGTAVNQHMVECFVVSLEHLTHLKRTMIMTFVPPNSTTLFRISELVALLQSMQQNERTLNFGT